MRQRCWKLSGVEVTRTTRGPTRSSTPISRSRRSRCHETPSRRRSSQVATPSWSCRCLKSSRMTPGGHQRIPRGELDGSICRGTRRVYLPRNSTCLSAEELGFARAVLEEAPHTDLAVLRSERLHEQLALHQESVSQRHR